MLTESTRENNEFGCLMCTFPKQVCKSLFNFGKKIIPDNILYFAPDDNYGREDEMHSTLLFGFQEDLTPAQIKNEILKNIKPFYITITALDKFEVKKEGYDVVILKIQSNTMNKLHKFCKNNYKNVQTFPIYRPHITLAYVKPNTFDLKKNNLNIKIPVTVVFYSPINGEKSYYRL